MSVNLTSGPLPERLRAAGSLYAWLYRLLHEAAERIETMEAHTHRPSQSRVTEGQRRLPLSGEAA